MIPVTCYIGIGSNLGDAGAHVRNAFVRLAGIPETRLSGESSLFRTAPVDADGEDYANAVARVETLLSPNALLEHMQAIEREFGRERPYPNAPRTLDLDLLLYGQQLISSPTLIVPHPRLTQRAFTLIPLLQLDPFVTIPGSGPAHAFMSGVAAQRIAKF